MSPASERVGCLLEYVLAYFLAPLSMGEVIAERITKYRNCSRRSRIHRVCSPCRRVRSCQRSLGRRIAVHLQRTFFSITSPASPPSERGTDVARCLLEHVLACFIAPLGMGKVITGCLTKYQNRPPCLFLLSSLVLLVIIFVMGGCRVRKSSNYSVSVICQQNRL